MKKLASVLILSNILSSNAFAFSESVSVHVSEPSVHVSEPSFHEEESTPPVHSYSSSDEESPSNETPRTITRPIVTSNSNNTSNSQKSTNYSQCNDNLGLLKALVAGFIIGVLIVGLLILISL